MKTTYVIGKAMVLAATLVYLPVQADVAHSGAARSTAPHTAKKKTGFTSAAMSGTGVTLAYKITGALKIGSPVTINIELSSTTDAEVKMTADQGLSMNPATPVLSVAAGQTTAQTLSVTPQSDGLLYVNVFSTANGRFSTKSIPLNVGNTANPQKSTGTMQTTPAGERIKAITLP
jgi:hypothetical protein